MVHWSLIGQSCWGLVWTIILYQRSLSHSSKIWNCRLHSDIILDLPLDTWGSNCRCKERVWRYMEKTFIRLLYPYLSWNNPYFFNFMLSSQPQFICLLFTNIGLRDRSSSCVWNWVDEKDSLKVPIYGGIHHYCTLSSIICYHFYEDGKSNARII